MITATTTDQPLHKVCLSSHTESVHTTPMLRFPGSKKLQEKAFQVYLQRRLRKSSKKTDLTTFYETYLE